MTSIPPVEFVVFPDDCDAYGHLNQAALVRLFERARWATLLPGPGMDVFTRHDVWPALRKCTVEFRAQAYAGDALRFGLELAHHGRTSFTFRQRAHRAADDGLVAEGEFVFVCVAPDGRPTPVPAEVSRFFGARPSMRPGETRHVEVGGVQLAMDTLGDGDPVLFLHGFPLDRTMWRQMAGTLTGRRRIAIDLRGFGLSDPAGDQGSMAAYADDVAGLLDALGLDQVTVCGLSMGGYVAFELLRRHPARLRALALISSRASADAPAGREARDAMISRIRRDGSAAIADEMLPRLLAPATLATQPQVIDRVRRMIGGNPPDGLVAALEAMRDRPDSTGLLAEIGVPVLVIAGREDQIVPLEETRTMADAIPGAQLTIVPDAGHLAPLEQPLHTARILGEFLDAQR